MYAEQYNLNVNENDYFSTQPAHHYVHLLEKDSVSISFHLEFLLNIFAALLPITAQKK